MTLEQALAKVAEHVHLGHGSFSATNLPDAEVVIEAEQRLGVSFPESYKQFVLRFGECEMFGTDICGLRADVSESWVVRLTEDARRTFHRMPGHLVVIEDSMDAFYCMDTSRISGGECPIVVYDYIAERVEEKDAFPSFTAFLIDRFDLDGAKGFAS